MTHIQILELARWAIENQEIAAKLAPLYQEAYEKRTDEISNKQFLEMALESIGFSAYYYGPEEEAKEYGNSPVDPEFPRPKYGWYGFESGTSCYYGHSE